MEGYSSEETNKIRQTVKWIVDIVVAIGFAWYVVYALGTQISVSGQSMVPLLSSEDVVLMNRLIYHVTTPKRFDIVVFKREDQKLNVKRIIGLPGETLQIKDGFIYINGSILEANESFAQVSLAGLAENPILLGEDEYFLLGDNRDSSEDSRFSNIGNVSRKQIKGKVWLRISPVSKMELMNKK